MAKQLDRDMAFAAGKLAAEQAFDEDKTEDMLFYARKISEIPENLMEDWKQGFTYGIDNVGHANYVRTNDIGAMRVGSWMAGNGLIEQTQAKIVVDPKTVNRIEVWINQEPGMSQDAVINMALDCFAHWYDLWFGAEMSGNTTESKVKRRLADLIDGKPYWDIIEEEEGVHYGETS